MVDKIYEQLLQYFDLPGVSLNQISKMTGVSRTNVKRKYQMYKNLTSLEDTRGPGRPQILKPSHFLAIGQYFRHNPSLSIKDLKKMLFEKHDVDISYRALRRALKSRDYVQKCATETVILTPAHIKARLEFVKKNKKRDWKKVIFSDEATFQLGPQTKRLWAKKGQTRKIPKMKFPTKIMVWGAISYEKKLNLQVCVGILKSDNYQGILNRSLIPFLRSEATSDHVFMQDNAPIHKSRSTLAFLNSKNVNLLDWPPCSPDLNPIENVWKMMKDVVHKKRPKTKIQLEAAIKSAWAELDQEKIKSLIDSMPRRVKDCLAAKGKITKY